MHTTYPTLAHWRAWRRETIGTCSLCGAPGCDDHETSRRTPVFRYTVQPALAVQIGDPTDSVSTPGHTELDSTYRNHFVDGDWPGRGDFRVCDRTRESGDQCSCKTNYGVFSNVENAALTAHILHVNLYTGEPTIHMRSEKRTVQKACIYSFFSMLSRGRGIMSRPPNNLGTFLLVVGISSSTVSMRPNSD